MVKVLYNGIDVFSANGAPTPFVGISDQMITYAQRWHTVKSITLDGMITGVGCTGTNSYLDLLKKQSGIYNAFSQDFKPLVVTDSSKVAFSGDYMRVNSIEFDRAPYFNTLNFKVNLTYYPQELFSGTFGVTAPVSTTKYAEQPDRTVNISRTISAKGFNTSRTSNNALLNAVNYVRSLTGTDSLVQPAFIPVFATSVVPGALGISGIKPRKITENINRTDGSYSVNLDYSIRETAQTSSVLSYTTDINYEELKGFYTVALKGSYKGTQDQSITGLRQEFNSYFKPYDLANSVFTKTINPTTGVVLNPSVESINVNEVQENNTIDFSYNYTTDPQSVRFDYGIDFNNNYLSDLVSVSFNGTLTAKGPQAGRSSQLESSLNNLDVTQLCQSEYLKNITTSTAALNPIFQKYEVKRNLTSANNSYSITASYDNSPTPPAGFRSFSWSVSVTPSINTYIPIQYLNGDNGAFNMKYFKRGKVTVQGAASFADNADKSTIVHDQALNILNQYAASYARRVRVVDKVDREQFAGENGYGYTFTLTDSCETPIFSK